MTTKKDKSQLGKKEKKDIIEDFFQISEQIEEHK